MELSALTAHRHTLINVMYVLRCASDIHSTADVSVTAPGPAGYRDQCSSSFCRLPQGSGFTSSLVIYTGQLGCVAVRH